MVVVITVLFFLHPSLTEKSFSFLRCVDIYETSRLQNDLEVSCWKGKHTLWAAGFAVPMLVICFSFPLFGIIWMLINRKRLQDIRFKRYFIFFYQGLHHKRSYWEFMNIIRKIIIISINVFIP